MDTLVDELLDLDDEIPKRNGGGMGEDVPAAGSSAVRVVVDAEGNGSISLEVPTIDLKKPAKSTVDPVSVDLAKPIRTLKSPREIKLKVSIVLLFVLIVASTTCILVMYVDEPLHYNVGSTVFYTGSREFAVHRNGANITRGSIGRNLPAMLPFSCDPFDDHSLCLEYSDIARLTITWEDLDTMDCYNLTWEALDENLVHSDCYMLDNIHWYGGAVSAGQQWPLEKMNQSRAPFISGDGDRAFGPIMERFWLSSHGVGIIVSGDSPLFVSVDAQMLCFEGTHRDSPFPNPEGRLPSLQYMLCSASDARLVLQKMTGRFRPKLYEIPQVGLSLSPVWSVPACNSDAVLNESTLVHFAHSLSESNLTANSLEIQCKYAMAEGDLTFDPERFPNITASLEYIKALGYAVGLIVTPFVNTDSEAFQEGVLSNYLVENPRAEVPGLTKWPGGVGALLDPTNNNTKRWFLNRLLSLQNTTGIDFFTFDYGQASYLPVQFRTAEQLMNPCTYTERYVELAIDTGSPIFTRSAFQSQDLPTIVLMLPKSTIWGYENGLKSVIPSALTLGILGYPFIMPDLAVSGQFGNPPCMHDCLPPAEFLLRWLGMTAFFPTMRINVPVWEYDPDTLRAARDFIAFHVKTISPLVLTLAADALRTGTPIIRPLWWIAPDDKDAQTIDHEFLLGDDMLVAPILDQGQTSRQVYLPEGDWVDQLHKTRFSGRSWVDCVAQIDQVPYFIRVK